MAANFSDYIKMYENIKEDTVVMAKCNCITCNGICSCRCRDNSNTEEISWELYT